MAKRGRPKKVSGSAPAGEGLSQDEMYAHLDDTFGVSKPEKSAKEADDKEEVELEPDAVISHAKEPESERDPVRTEEKPAPGDVKASKKEEGATKEQQKVEAKEEKGDKPDAVREGKEKEGQEEVTETAKAEGEPQPEKKEGESVEAVKSGFLRDIKKLKDRNAELEKQLREQIQGQLTPPAGATSLPPSEIASQGAVPTPELPSPSNVPLAWDPEGRPVFPDPSDPKVKAYFRQLQEPTPQERQAEYARQAQIQQLAQQREFDAAKHAFIQEDPRREPIVDRVQAATQHLDLRTLQLIQQTGEQPVGTEAVMEFIERWGLGDEFRQYVPEVSKEEMPYFLEAVAGGSNYVRRRYMTEFCNRVLGPSGGNGSGGQAETTGGVKPLPGNVPPRLASKGSVNPDRDTKPGKQERMEELAKQKREDPFAFTEVQNKELTQLREDLGITW